MHPFECRVSKNSKEIRKPSLVINAKKWKTIEWERLKISSREGNGSSSSNLFKKIRDTKGIFHAKMGTIKDRNGPNRSRRY